MANTDLILSLPNKDVDSYVVVTSGEPAWTNGEWVEIDKGIKIPITLIGFTYQINTALAKDTTYEAVFSIQIGGNQPYTTKIQLPVSIRSDTNVAYYLNNNSSIFFPEGLDLLAGDAIRIAVADSSTSADIYSGIRILYTATTDTAYSPRDIYPTNYKRFGGSAIIGGN